MVVQERISTHCYVGPARSEEEVTRARSVHSQAYAREGLISPLVEGELFDDGWLPQRQWLVVANDDDVLGAASLISPKDALPTLTAFDLRPTDLPALASAWAGGRVREVSALARDAHGRGALTGGLLYRALWLAQEQQRDHDVWIMSMQTRRLDHLRRLFPVPFELLGRAAAYYNHASVACLLDLRLARSALSLRAPRLLAWLNGEHEDQSVLLPHARGARARARVAIEHQASVSR
jgi:hypothetical protein